MAVEKRFNEVQVGVYYAICQAPDCEVLVPMPIIAYQRAARLAKDSTVVVEPDLSEGWKHFRAEHAELMLAIEEGSDEIIVDAEVVEGP